jgi:hypothetical protein
MTKGIKLDALGAAGLVMDLLFQNLSPSDLNPSDLTPSGNSILETLFLMTLPEACFTSTNPI